MSQSADSAGLTIAGYLSAESGMGQVGRLMVATAEAAGLPHSTITYDRTVVRQQHRSLAVGTFSVSEAAEAAAAHDVNLVCVNADELPNFVADADPELFDRRYTIGVWAWETSGFPSKWRHSFRLVDEIWGISRHTAHAVAAQARGTPVRAFPLPVPVPALPDPRLREIDRARLGLPDGTLFSYWFDYLSVFERKNPLAAIDAFRQAFEPGEGATLLIKTVNANRSPDEHRKLLDAASSRPDVLIRDGYLSSADQAALTRATDIYVSLHRAEGFGLTLAESMALAKPVVATAYSGNMDFMTPESAMLVPYDLVDIPADCDPYVPGDQWAEPHVSEASAAMRVLFDDPALAAKLGERARQHMIDEHSLEVRGRQLAERLEEIRGSEGYERARGRSGPSIGRPRRVWAMLRHKVVSKARRILLRLLRPELESLRAELTAIDPIREQVFATPYIADRQRVWTSDQDRLVLGFGPDEGRGDASPQRAGDRYREFEAVFRGSEPFIRDRMSRYVEILLRDEPALLGSGPILDVGCGRGELLEVLTAAGADAVGVESDAGMVQRCRAKGLTVEHGDAFDYLADATGPGDDRFAAVFAVHVVEHLPPDEVLRFLQLAHDRLADGGRLVFETVNPNCLAALKTFWVDLTHVHPIYPEVAVTLCRQAGFASGRVRFPHSELPYDQALTRAGEYAVFASRRR